MGKTVRQEGPIDAYELFAKAQESDSIPDIFGNNSTHAMQRSGNFDRTRYKNVPNASPYDDPQRLGEINVNNQSGADVIKNAAIQFGANAVSSFGQGLANTFDLVSNAKSIKGIVTGANDDFDSSFMGISTRDMQDWANNIAQRHEILEKDPGSFDLTDIGWWGKQAASTGTGIGMGLEALGETAAIEWATGGMGTATAISRLGKLVKNIATGAKGLNRLDEAFQVAKGMKSAATIYGVMNRLNESRMEATNSYDDITNTLSEKKNEDGTPKYTTDEIKHLASEGSRRDYYWNLALLPLDILSYRSMVFNPISGSATNWVEKGLEKVAGAFGESKIGKATGWLAEKSIGSNIEGLEEGFQQVGSDEGKHYAQVLGGLDDGKNFAQRFGEDVTSDDFWNNYAGGVLGSPVIGGAMNLVNKITTGNRAAKLEAEHKNYIKEAGKMNSAMSAQVSKLEKEGKTEEANQLRRKHGALDILSRLHLDATLDKTSAFDSKMTFLAATLGELNEGKTDALGDLGFNLNVEDNADQLSEIKKQFRTFVDDANVMKSIYDDVKTKYNKNFVPSISYDHFVLNKMQDQMNDANTAVTAEKNKIGDYNMLTNQGKQIHDIDYQVQALTLEKDRLTNLYRTTKNAAEKENINKLIQNNKSKLTDASNQLAEIQKDENYSEYDKETDNDILKAKLYNKGYAQAVYDKENLENSIAIQRKNVALWNDPEYIKSKTVQAIPKAKTKQQVRNNIEALATDTKTSPEIVQAAVQRENEIESDDAANEAPKPGYANSNLFGDDHYEFADEILAGNTVTDTSNDISTTSVNPQGIIEGSFSPNIYDFDKSTDEAKQKVKNGVGGLMYKLGTDASFEDLVRHFGQLKGLDQADKIFESLKYGWKANGKELSDAEASTIYNKIFGNPEDELIEGASQLLLKNAADLEAATTDVLEDVVGKQEKPDGFDTNNQPVYTYKGRVTNEASPKMAFTTRLSNLIRTVLEDGSIETSYEYTENELNTGQYVDSLQLLDPDSFTDGTPLEIKIPANFNEILVPIFLPNGMKDKAMPFGQWVAQTKVKPKSSPYGTIAADYLLNSGVDSILSTDYLIQALSGTFTNASSLIEDIRNKYINKIGNLGNIKDVINTSSYNDIIAEIKDAINKSYNNKEVDDLFNQVIQYPTGLPNKLGSEISNKLDRFNTSQSERAITPEDQEYKDKVPMIIYKKGTKAGEKGISFVHDIGWYHPLRFNQDKPGDMKEAIASTRDIRRELLESNNNSIPATITGKRQTTFEGLIDKTGNSNNLISLSEANPQTQLTVVTGDGILSNSRKNQLFPNNNSTLVNTKSFKSGQVIEVRRYGLKDGKQTFIALPITRAKIDDEAKRSIFQAISIYAGGKNPAHQKVVDHIKSVMGHDITSTVGLKNYLSHFINIFDPNKSTTNKEIEDQAKSLLAPTTPYISFLSKSGNIVFGQAGVTMYVDENKKNLLQAQYVKQGLNVEDALNRATEDAKVNSRFINPGRPDLAPNVLKELLKGITVTSRSGNTTETNKYPDRLSWYETNLSIDNYPTNKPVVTIDKNNTTTVGKNYHDYLMDRFKTNIKSYNIGTKENPNYVTNIQPVITYDSNSRLDKQVEGTQEEVKPIEVVNPVEIIKPAGLDEETQKIIEAAKKRLGSDLGSSTKFSMSPTVLTDEQRDDIARDISKIANLDPIQQETITNFIFNEIVSRVNFESGSVKREELDKEVKNIFLKEITSRRNEDKAEAERLQKIVNDNPTIDLFGIQQMVDDFNLRIDTVNALEDSYKSLQEIAYAKVAKYTGITQSTVNDRELNVEEGENEYADQDSENPTDFWTDVLTESPENKVTYSVRRFFSQVKRYDKNGNQLSGWLNLPLFTDSSEIIRNLMVNLADVPSNFDSMIAKLETTKEKYPWMQEVINKLTDTKLSQQKKNQFVTMMSNTKLRMQFSMIGYNRFNKTWNTKLLDTTSNGISDILKKSWKNNLVGNSDYDLILTDPEGNYYLNDKKAQSLINRFESWIGINLKIVQSDLAPIRQIVGTVTNTKSATIAPTGSLLTELKSNIVKKGDRMQFPMFNRNYQIISLGDNKFEVSILGRPSLESKKEEITNWLSEFGIELSPKTVDVLLKDGLYHNYKQNSPVDLLDIGTKTNGLFGILYNQLKDLVRHEGIFDFTEYGNNPLDNSVISSLADLEAQYNTTETPFGFRVNKKSYFALTAPKFITDRARDLKDQSSDIREKLAQISFSKNSLWLTLLNDDTFREYKFTVTHDGAETLKQTGKKSYRDRAGITDISDMDHELTKLSKFQVSTQGAVIYGTEGSRTYPGTSIPLRMSTMAGLTSSDKSIMMNFNTAVLDLSSSDLQNGMSDQLVRAIYEQTIRPELNRMIQFSKNGGQTNVSGYNKGASMFFMMPMMNNIMYSGNLKLIDAIKNQPDTFNEAFIENNDNLKKDIYGAIRKHINDLVEDKLKTWENNNFVSRKLDNSIDEIKFFDTKYLNKFREDNETKLKYAAMDYEINSLIANANNFMLFAGDPAMYYKSKSADTNQQVRDTFTNITKRLANQIAPGVPLANSKGEKYIQLFLEDRESISNNIDYLEKLYGVEGAAPYRNIKGSDAQEYTTWKEHLDILTKLGKTPDFMSDISTSDIDTARELLSSGKKLTDEQIKIIQKVMQPIKPVYTGQLYDKKQDIMRTVYIKSSSFPLIPQLTKGFEIDKLRVAMEKLEKDKKMNVRASYQTANKVGSINNPISLWNKDGNIDEENLKSIDTNNLILDRENFRIQQEVPYKSDKVKQDTITLGTQLMKLLFGDDVMNLKGFNLDGKEYNGKELYNEYTNAFIDLIGEKKNQLFNELGLDNNGTPIDTKETRNKLQSLLQEEAVKRGYPLQDIAGLKIDDNGDFTMPLWSSTNSNRYESMLNSIVSHRMVGMKLPGASFVTGSEEGFKTKKKEESDLTASEKSNIIYTSAWDGNSLKSNQVLIPSKFRDNNGNLVDLLDSKYSSIVDGQLRLNEDMFDKELLSHLSFRIPTSGHQSGSKIEIAGFLPHTMGDLIIVPRNFTTQKGLDFDIDKENVYMLWHTQNKDGKFEVLSEKHKQQLLIRANESKENRANSNNENANTIFNDILDGAEYTNEDIKAEPKLQKVNSLINERLLQNKIIAITRAVYDNTSDKMQSKINKTLGTEYAEAQAEMIDSLINSDKNKIWSPISSEYQKQAMLSGASGKIGTGAYSLDVVFHSLAQQAATNGKPIRFFYNESADLLTDKGNTVTVWAKSGLKKWRFGNIESTGILGNNTTLDGGRSIASVMSERQNIAVDNASLGVMGKINLNDLTMDVDKVFNMLGIDKGEDGNSIPFLFLSQPIIREYVNLMKNANSIMADFENNKENKIVNQLLGKYDPREELEEDYWDIMSPELNNTNFINALSTPTPDGKLQGAVLRRFMEMKQYGIALRGIQTSINFKNNSLGKSFFDVIEKKNSLNRIGNDSCIKNGDGEVVGNISGASGLIGDFIPISDAGNLQDNKEYINIGDFLVKPTTIMGAFNIQATNTAYNLWGDHFPYDIDAIQAIFNEIAAVVGSGDMSATKSVELRQDVFKHIKKYLSSSRENGIISNDDNVNKERERLYIDNDTNISLAKYISQLRKVEGNAVVNTFIKTNKLLNSLEFTLNKNGQPSLLRFNNASGEQFDEQFLYESLSTLLKKNGANGTLELPQIGNKKYTLDTLAQDLIVYSFLGNSTQEAIQFTKYVPISYLNATGYSQWLKNNLENSLGLNSGNSTPENQKHFVKEFSMQYVQHNAGKVKYKLDNKNWNNKTKSVIFNGSKSLDNLQSFELIDNVNPTFVSIYNSFAGKDDKQQLYWYDGAKYTKIPTLGTFGMDEYQLGESIGTSIVNGKVKINTEPQQSVNKDSKNNIQNDPFDVQSEDLSNVLTKIAENNLPGLSEIAKSISPFIGSTTIGYATAVADRTNFDGIFMHDDNAIYMHSQNNKDYSLDKKAKIILHEVIHSLTINQIKPYITQNPNGSVDVKANAPTYVSNIVRLYNDIRSRSNEEELNNLLNRIKTNQIILPEEFKTNYGLTDIYEFMSMAFTEPDFQKYLSGSQFKQSGQTLFDRFKQVIVDILNKLGVQFDTNTATVHAIDSIFEFIKEENKNSISKESQDMWNDVMNSDDSFISFDEFNDSEPEASFSYPSKTLNIQEEKCL